MISNPRFPQALFVAFVLAACGDDSGSADQAATGRGSVACQDWQDALCDFASGRCGLSRTLCDEQAHGVECLSDEHASECANLLDDASCSAPPLGCDLPDIADPAPAIAACNDLLAALCERDMRCGGQGQLDDCLAEQAQRQALGGFTCGDALAVDLRYEDCVAQLEAPDCGPVDVALCTQVIRALPPK